MITSFEVGAIFKLVDEASPTLRKLLGQIKLLREQIDAAKLSLDGLGKNLGLSAAIGETSKLAAEWRGVDAAVIKANLSMDKSGAAARRAAAGIAAPVGGGGGRGGVYNRGGHRGGGGLGGGSIGLPGGTGHVRLSGPAMAAAATYGWGVDQALKTESYIWQAEDISGLPHDEATHRKFRKMLYDFEVRRGRSIDETGEAMLSGVRLNQSTPGGGIDNLPEFLESADTEARRKKTGLNEAMTANLELAHQLRVYDPAGIRKLMATFAAFSVADPRTLSGMSRASGYAVPALMALGVDPGSTLLAGTALARAGISSTKSGTWIREAVTRAMPGTSMMSKMAFKKHEAALRKFNLVDEDGKPTWYTDGVPDELKMFRITGEALRGMTPEERAGYGRAAFGAQGFGAVATLGDPVVLEQVRKLDEIRKSKAFLDRYNSYGTDSLNGTTMQDARVALAQFNVTTGELARTTLPALNIVLGNFRSILEGIRSVLPGGAGKDGALIGARAMEFAGLGAVGGGLTFGPAGAVLGAIGGGVIGGAEGVAEQYMKNMDTPTDRFGRAVIVTGNSAAEAASGIKALGDAIRGLPAGPGGVFPGGTSREPISLSLNVDGTLLARTLSNVPTYSFAGQAPAFDGTGEFALPHHQDTSN